MRDLSKLNIVYINGYGGEESNKPAELSKLLKADVKHLKFRINNDGSTNYDYIDDCLLYSEDKVDLIIASSTGAYIARSLAFVNNIPLVALNPVIDILETFEKIGVTAPQVLDFVDLSIESLVLLSEGDELISASKSAEFFKDRASVVMFKGGDHRFTNLEVIVPEVLEFIERTVFKLKK